jgi:hypothetical protein
MSDSFSISEAIIDNNGDLATLSAPSINDSGTIALFGTLDNGDRGFFTVDDEITPVVRDSELNGESDLIEDFSFNNNGTLVYTVESLDPSSDSRTVDLILDRNGLMTTIDSLNNNSQLAQRYNNFVVNDNDVVVANNFTGAPRVSLRELSLFFPDGTSERIELAGSFTGENLVFDRLGIEDINNQNIVAYTATIFAEDDTSIYTTDGRVIPLSTADLGEGTLDRQKDIVINDSGTILINIEQPSGEDELLQSTAEDSLNTLVSTDGLFDSFDEIALNNEGQIAFGAVLDDGTEGIFTGIDPQSDRLIAVGDPLSGSTVVDLEFDTEGLNNSGTISFQAELADGTVGIYQADLTHVEVEANPINGTDRADILRGTAAADLIDGGNGRDLLIALAGNDTLMGGNGRDVLVGVAPNSKTPGVGEIDVLVGGKGNDTFDLGGIDRVYYDDGDATTGGEADYALISDLENGDVIVLRGSADDYLLENNFSINGELGTAILRQDSTNEIISLVKDASDLNLNTNNFVFV